MEPLRRVEEEVLQSAGPVVRVGGAGRDRHRGVAHVRGEVGREPRVAAHLCRERRVGPVDLRAGERLRRLPRAHAVRQVGHVRPVRDQRARRLDDERVVTPFQLHRLVRRREPSVREAGDVELLAQHGAVDRRVEPVLHLALASGGERPLPTVRALVPVERGNTPVVLAR